MQIILPSLTSMSTPLHKEFLTHWAEDNHGSNLNWRPQEQHPNDGHERTTSSKHNCLCQWTRLAVTQNNTLQPTPILSAAPGNQVTLLENGKMA